MSRKIAIVLCTAAVVFLWCTPAELAPSTRRGSRLRRSRPDEWSREQHGAGLSDRQNREFGIMVSELTELVNGGQLSQEAFEAIVSLYWQIPEYSGSAETSTTDFWQQGDVVTEENNQRSGNVYENQGGGDDDDDFSAQLNSQSGQVNPRSNELPSEAGESNIWFPNTRVNDLEDYQNDDGCSHSCSTSSNCCDEYTCELGMCRPKCQPVPAGRSCSDCPCEDGLECRTFTDHREVFIRKICVPAYVDEELCDGNGDCDTGHCCAFQRVQVLATRGVALTATCKPIASHPNCDKAVMHPILDMYIGICPCQML